MIGGAGAPAPTEVQIGAQEMGRSRLGVESLRKGSILIVKILG
jgi:hypothetical protein